MAANVRPLKHLKLDPTGRQGGTEPGEEGGPRALLGAGVGGRSRTDGADERLGA